MIRGGIGLLVALALLGGCDDTQGRSGDPVKPAVVPPQLAQVFIKQDQLDRVETVRVALKDPLPLPATQIDAFLQSPGVVDILWVVSNAGSMANEKVRLAGDFQRFFDALVASQSDFHMGVISTDQNQAGLLQGTPAVIDRNTPNAQAVFLANITFPATRVRWVEALRMTQIALTGANDGASFLRPNAALAVIAVANSDDESFGGVPYYARFLRGVKGQGNEGWVTFSSIAGDLPSGCTPPGEAIYYGSHADPAVRLVQMAHSTAGVVGSICDPSFEDTLTQIAEALNTLRRTFPLSLKPDPGTISVTVNGAPVAADPSSGWTYVASNNTIQFLGSYIPPPGATIQIQYAIASA